MSKEVKRYNFDVDKFGSPRAYESEHGRWMKRADYDALLAERDALKEKARKFGFVEKAMEALACDEREGGIVTAASLILISSAHRMNAKRGVIDQEGVTFDDGQIGDWRVTIERIDAALQGEQP